MNKFSIEYEKINLKNPPLFRGNTYDEVIIDTKLIEFTNQAFRAKNFHLIYAGDSQKVEKHNNEFAYEPIDISKSSCQESVPIIYEQGKIIPNHIGKLYGESMSNVIVKGQNLHDKRFISFDFFVNCPAKIYINGLVINEIFYPDDAGVIFVMKHKIANSLKLRRFEGIKLIDNDYRLVVSRFGKGLESPKFNDNDHTIESIIGVMTGIYHD